MADFGSRKFLITLAVIGSAVGIALAGEMDNNVAMVLIACVAAYNWANVRIKQNGSAPKL